MGLPAGKLAGATVGELVQPKAGKPWQRGVKRVRAAGAGEQQRKCDVFQAGQLRHKLTELKHEAESVSPQRASRGLAEGVDPVAGEVHLTGVRHQDPRQAVQQRRLARAARPHDRDDLASLDFEVGTDRLYLETSSYTLSSWADVTTPYGPAAQIHLTQPNDDRTVTLVGVSASTMNALPIGFDTVSGAQNTSGPGEDFFYDRYTTASTYNFGSHSGQDIIVGFDTNLDTLVFPDTPTATDTTYHGDPALLLTFDGGQSSVLLDGLTTADLPHLLFG